MIESVKEHDKMLPIDRVFAEDAHKRPDWNTIIYRPVSHIARLGHIGNVEDINRESKQ